MELPLFTACSAGSVSCTELLLKMGADVNPPNTVFSPLHIACSEGYPKITSILINAGANLNASTHQDTCLNNSHGQHLYVGTPLHTASLFKSTGLFEVTFTSSSTSSVEGFVLAARYVEHLVVKD
ncbi:hypothetical protein CEXT_575771 [Caerostris extrusa]|uniref:Uncharacterized protein n=1 Tax=Caerostris extrusa TaxID=172846 RepID=A0AAV4M500_CAEEX|nr:hypothetical protein CEXT_575771 [Caerostris extrusa]